jgi:tetratricopeptide (TPR) repeat protein
MRVLESALALIPDPPPSRAAASQLAEIELGLGGIAFRQGRFADAERWVARAADRAVREGSDAHVVAHAYYALEAARDYLRGDQSTTLRRKALAIYQELGDVSGEATTANSIGLAAYFAGQWNEALRFYRRAHALDRTAGNFESLAVHLNNEGEILSDQGHLDEAAAIFTEARSLFVTIDQAFGTAVTTSNLARVTVRSGRPGDAASGFNEALTVFEKIGAGSFGLETRARIGEMYVVAGEHRTAHHIAAATLEQLGESASPGLVALLERILGYAAFQNFEPDVAAEHFRRSLAAAQADRADFEAALTLVAAAELAERTGLEEPSILRAEGQEILDRLEVVALPPVPLPETFFEPREHRL